MARLRFPCLWMLMLTLAGVPVRAAEPAEWTILFYMACDNNLEIAQLADMHEIMAVGGSDQVNLVTLLDRSPKSLKSAGYTDAALANLPNWANAKLLKIGHNHLDELANWGDVNMGDPATLRRFLDYGLKQFPARRTALIFCDHGGGWTGVCGDEGHHHDMLTMNEIHTTLKGLPKPAGRFDIIGFDACLMGNLEVAYAVAPFGKVMIASEELEPGYGWFYTPVLTELNTRPTMTGADVAKSVVKNCFEFYQKSTNAHIRQTGIGTTLSAIDLTKIPAVVADLQQVAKACRSELTENGRESWLVIADARERAEQYGKSASNDTGYGLIDLAHLVKLLRGEFTEGPVDKAALAMETSLKSAVIANRHGKGRKHAQGLSIFFPVDTPQLTGKADPDKSTTDPAPQDRAHAGANDYASTIFASSQGWLSFIQDYARVADEDTEDPVLSAVEATTEVLKPGEEVTVTATVNADDLAESYMILARRKGTKRTILGEWPVEADDEGTLSHDWDGRWFMITDGETRLICPISNRESVEGGDENDPDADPDGEGTEYYVEVPAQLKRSDSDDWVDVSLYFYVDFGEEKVTGEFVYAFMETKLGPSEVQLQSGDRLRPVYRVIDDDGTESYAASDNDDEILEIDEEDDLSIETSPVKNGKYDIGFQVVDFSENVAEEFVTLQVTK